MEGQAYKWDQAHQIALELVELLAGGCDRIEIAGSIRRHAPRVRDCDIVCVPRMVQPAELPGREPQLFDDLPDLAPASALTWALAGLLERGTITRGRAWGPRQKQLYYRGLKVELWCVLEPAQYGCLLAIRTGPADFSHLLVTARRLGGAMPEFLQQRAGALWYRAAPEQPALVTPTEQAFFEQLALRWEDWRRPEDRSSERLIVSLAEAARERTAQTWSA